MKENKKKRKKKETSVRNNRQDSSKPRNRRQLGLQGASKKITTKIQP